MRNEQKYLQQNLLRKMHDNAGFAKKRRKKRLKLDMKKSKIV